MVGNALRPVGYDLISQLAPLILEHQGNGTMSAVLLGPNDPPQKVQVGNYTLEVAFSRPRRRGRGARTARAGEAAASPASAAIFIATGPDEFFAAGSGVTVSFSPNTPGPPLAGLGTVEEGAFVNGRWVPGRQLAGDDTEQGQYLSCGIGHPSLHAVPLPLSAHFAITMTFNCATRGRGMPGPYDEWPGSVRAGHARPDSATR